MKNITVIVVFMLVFFRSNGQEVKVDVGYKYLYSNQWDKAIQMYNFSRPNLIEKQPLLMHGLNTSISSIFKSTKNVKQGLNVSYSYFRSLAENENSINLINLHFLNMGYMLHYENSEKLKGLYTDFMLSVTSSGVFRRLNEAPFIYDETQSKAFGIGGEINVKCGYYFKLKNKAYFSPYVMCGYTPYLFSPNTEVVINQTKGLASKNWTSILTGQVGLAFHLK